MWGCKLCQKGNSATRNGVSLLAQCPKLSCYTHHTYSPHSLVWSLLDLRLQKLEVEEEEGKGKESIGFHGSLPCISFRSPLYGSSIGEQQVADLRHWKCLPLLPSSLYFSRTCRESDFDIFPYMQCQHFTPEYKNSIYSTGMSYFPVGKKLSFNKINL